MDRELLARPFILPPLHALSYNLLMYCIASEEEHSTGQSNYCIPQAQSKQLVYAGFAGIRRMLMEAKRHNALELGLFSNIREGNWLMEYYIGRIKRESTLNEVRQCLI